MKTFGPIYVDTLKYYHKNIFPIIERGWTREIDPPYRSGTCLVFRLPMTTPGLIIGVWTDTPNINIDNDDEVDELLKKALVAKSDKFTVEEIGEWNV